MKSIHDVTIYDIARALNISASTVSRGLRDHPHVRKEVKNKILLTARKMGYQQNIFASNLRQKFTSTIGVVIPRLDSYFMSTVISGMENSANSQGYNLIISQSQESLKKESDNITTMFNSRVDGLLVSLSYETQNLDHFNVFFRKGIPVVFFDRVGDHPKCKSVIINNYKAGYEATLHLIDQGCKNIMHLAGSLNRNVYADRFNGYKQALNDNGLPFDDNSLIVSDLSSKAGEDAAQAILKQKILPDGIFCANDHTAIALICEFKQAGIRIPEDMCIVGFNNDPVSRVVEPNLTTVNYPGREMGEIAASILINTLKNNQNPMLNSVVLTHSLIIRQSSRRK
ncbi:MAG TPA: LacI family DNA-binding transcriptional regulator [Bacteroidales bacterium]|nr:LacI family DNA-binding transcriptional regulator [Bacteroidales bacterium]